MVLRILSDVEVRSLLLSLNNQQMSALQDDFKQSLLDYSTAGKENGASSHNQVSRSVVTRPSGLVNLFMPAMSNSAIGTKMLGVPPSTGSSEAESTSEPKRTAPRGGIFLLTPEGDGMAVVAAEELTAFRTSLAALFLFKHRRNVENVVVFGAGKQAIWHIRLALLLRGSEIKSISIVNRSSNRTEALVSELQEEIGPKLPASSSLELKVISSSNTPEVERMVSSADAIFCTTPSTTPLFPPELLTQSEKKDRYVTTIGSYKPSMTELHPDLLRHVVDSDGYHPGKASGGAIIVDIREGVLEESGEVIQGGIQGESLVELGEVFDAESRGDARRQELHDWLSDGFVLYKGVGHGVMDVSVAESLVRLSIELGIGVAVPEF